MAFLSKMLRGSSEKLSSDPIRAWLMDLDGMGTRTYAGRRVSPENSLQVSAVMSCVRVLSETMATMPLKVFRKRPNGGRVEAVNLPIYRILHQEPNDEQTAFEWIEMVMNHLCTRGNAYLLKKAGQYGAISELMPLAPDRMTVKRERGTREIFYEYLDEDGNRSIFLPDELVHIRYMIGKDGFTGISPVQYAKESIGLAKATEEYGGSLFANGAVPKLALETDQKLDPSARKTMEDLWHDNYGGTGNHNKTAVLGAGLKAKVLSINPNDAQFLETRKYQVEEIARIFRVPLHLIGDLSRSTNNNIEHQSLEFVMYTMLPWVRRIEAALNRSVIANYGPSYYCQFLVEGLLRGDLASRAEWYRKMREMGVFSADEIRDLEDFDPIGEEDGGNKRFVNGAYVDLKLAGDPNLGKPDVQPSPPQEGGDPTVKQSEALPKARTLLMAELGKMLRWEIAETNKIGKSPEKLFERLEAFHREIGEKSAEKLTPILELLEALGVACKTPLSDVLRKHFEASQTAIVEGCECPAEKLAETVIGLTEKWDSRALKIVEELGI